MNYFLKSLFIFSFLILGCQAEEHVYVHSITDISGLPNTAIISYASDFLGVGSTGGIEALANTDDLVSQPLSKGDLIINKVGQGNYTITVKDNNGQTSFTNIPEKYLNLNATLELTRDIFQPYFPAEWEAMNGTKYTSLRIKSKQDEGVFYIKTVYTGTDKEIGKYSEDY
ncbi:MAG TPA: hypothetical protein DEQ56_10380 [Bacteroidetes bacterium]|jgi:hypothetical protein|nr:hypothetical protein [Bacteroidota bacterium]